MRWLSAVVALLLAQTSLAQEDTSDEDEIIDLGVIVVEADALPPPTPEPEPAASLDSTEPAAAESIAEQLADSTAVTVITGEQFADAASISDVMERVAGADIRRGGGSGQLDTVLLRGARAQQVLVLIDGAPLMPGQVADLSLLPAASIERIEIICGPEASRFGAGALGGVVNVVTKRHEGNETTASLRAGNNQLYELDLAGAHADWDWVASQFCAENDFRFERQAGGLAVRQNNDVSRQQLWLRRDDDEGHAVRLGLSRLERGVPGSAEFPTLQARLQRENLWLQADGADHRVDLSLQRTHFTDPQPYLMQGALDARDTRLHAELSYGALALKPGDFGVRPRLDFISSSDYGSKLRGGVDIGWFGTSGGTGRRACRLLHHYDIGATVSSDAGADPLARYALSYRLSETTSAYLSAGYAVRHPDFEELYLSNQGSVQGNPDLTPERVLSYEAGLRSSGCGWSVAAAAFYSDYRDSILFAPVSAYLVRAMNTGEATVAGAEATFAVDLSDSMNLSTAATWMPLAELASGLPLPGRAEKHVTTTLSLSDGPWRGSATADYTGAMTADMFGSLRIAPRTIVNFDVWRELDDDSELGVQVSNAFNTYTRDAWHYPLPGREIFVTWRTNL